MKAQTAPTASIAIVGRPNVGKSTLFNLLTEGEKAVVNAQAGTTRDTRQVPARLLDLNFNLFDTAGVEEGKVEEKGARKAVQKQESRDDLAPHLNKLALMAAEKAGLLLFMVDGKAGLTPADAALASKLRKYNKPTILIVNKADVKGVDDTLPDFQRLGFGDPILFSAAHSMGIDALYEALKEHVTPTEDEPAPTEGEGEETEKPIPPPRLAIVGRPNAGKSTLVNALLGEARMLVGPTAGLTREAIAHPFRYGGQELVLIDTPGLRKRAKITDELEGQSVGQAITAIRTADVVVLMVDASGYSIEKGTWRIFGAQDAKIADVIAREAKALIVALNKWDMVEDKPGCLADVKAQLKSMLHTINAPAIVPLSALQRQGVGAVIKAAVSVYQAMTSRTSTSKLNKLLEAILAKQSPPLAQGKPTKLKYLTQVATNPPTVAVWGNRVDKLPDSYKQFLRNQLVTALGWEALPVRLVFRSGDNPYKGKGGSGPHKKPNR